MLHLMLANGDCDGSLGALCCLRSCGTSTESRQQALTA